MKEFKYTVGNKTYVQRPLVLGQIRQLMGLLEGQVIPKGLDAVGAVMLLKDRLPDALAVVLTPKDKSPGDKNISELARELEFQIDPETTIKVVEDFFTCNPIASFAEKLAGTIERITENVRQAGKAG